MVSGTWWVNSGDDFDPDHCVAVPAGGFVRRVRPHAALRRREERREGAGRHRHLRDGAGRSKTGGPGQAGLASGLTPRRLDTMGIVVLRAAHQRRDGVGAHPEGGEWPPKRGQGLGVAVGAYDGFFTSHSSTKASKRQPAAMAAFACRQTIVPSSGRRAPTGWAMPISAPAFETPHPLNRLCERLDVGSLQAGRGRRRLRASSRALSFSNAAM